MTDISQDTKEAASASASAEPPPNSNATQKTKEIKKETNFNLK